METNALVPVYCVLAAALSVMPALGAQSPYARPNNSWIGISGMVKSVERDRFVLDYGDGSITVEMDDGDRDGDAYALVPGDKVTVTGKVDADLFEKTTIEAANVYVEKLGTTFYASEIDEEDLSVAAVQPVVISKTVVQGTVTDVRSDEFVIDTGSRRLTIGVGKMPYNPLDDEGYQRIEPGDFVSVVGNMDRDVLADRRLVASAVTEIVD